ncbi:MAG: helix-hairpin-helix domain-containing protein [Balneolaceae bacterium]|nr:MAG: helix-hairpin-helix domain-containing protein [Balneolaceae bacterium]
MRRFFSQTYQYSSFEKSARLAVLISAVFISASLFPQTVLAQEQDTTRVQVERDLERAIEDIDPEESDLDLEELIEFLENLANNPMNVNRATVDDLMQIPGLNFRLAQNIVRYRTEQAPFTSVEDLGNVSGIGPATLGRIRPYVTIGTGLELGRDLYLNPRFWTNNSRFEAFSRYQQVLQEQEGYTRPDTLGGYLGSPVKYYQRFRYTSNHLSLNLTQDKDPGEPLTGPTDFDFTSWHFEVRDIGRLQNLVVGDFSVAFGQGLLLWSGGAFGKGRDVIRGPSKNERGVRPFTSAQEAIGFRGVAATVGNRLQFTGFYSDRQRTATVIDENTVNFPTESGFHRTLNERDRRNNLGQTTVGGRVRAQIPYGFLGVSAFHNHFDRTVARGSQPYQQFNFSGQNLAGYAADYRLLLGDAILFGEFAYTDNGGYGFLSGMEYDLGRLTDLLFVYRHYDKALQSIFGAGFGEQSGRPRNEQGFYIGIRHALTDQIRLSGYFDQFKFPAPRFQTTQPTSGYDWLASVEYQPFRELSMYLLARYKVRDQEYTDTDALGRSIRLLDDNTRTNVRFQADYQVHPRVRLRTRFDMVRAQAAVSDASWGYLVFQDIRFYPTPRLQIDARITMFDTDDFDSRVFQFENDLLYVLSNTMLFDQGQRMYFVIKYEATNWLDFWFKAATTVYENRNVISSGLAQIDGNRRSDIGIQARVRF